MAALLWLALVAVALVYLFIRSRTRHAPAAAAPAPAKAPAQAEPIAPAAEELRRRRAALLDRAAQTAPTAPTPPPPVKPLNLRALTEAQIVTPTPAPPPPKSVAADAPPPAQPFPARTPSPLPVSAASPPKPPAPVALPSLETFLAQVLRVTLNPPLSLSASSGTGLLRMLYLPASGAELKDKELASLEPAQIDALVAEAQALLDGALRLPFVLSAFAQLERRALPAAVALPWRRALAAQMAILLLEAPQSIASSPRPNDMPISQFITALLAAEAFPLSSESLTMVVEQMGAAERAALFSPIWQRLRSLMHRSSLSNSAFTAPLTALQRLVSCPLLCASLVGERNWLPEPCAGSAFETQPYLSVFLRVYAFEDRETLYQHFAHADLAAYQQGEPQAAVATLQAQIRAVQHAVHSIVLSLLRERASRDATLRYLRAALAANAARAQLGAQVGLGRAAACSHGFMLNLSALLLALTAPYAAAPKSPAGAGAALDAGLLLSPVFDNATRVLMGEAELREWRAAQGSAERLHFVSESFALAHGAMRVGLGPAVRHYVDLLRALSRAANTGGAEHPQLRQLLQLKLSMDVHLQDDAFLSALMRLCGFTADWLLTLLYPAAAAWPPAPFPPPKPHAAAWGAVPEAVVEETGEALSLVALLPDPPLEGVDSLASLYATLMCSPHLLRNPHLRPRLFSFLYPFTAAGAAERRGTRIYATIDTNAVWAAHLPRILLSVYNDAEATARDKYSLRREVSATLRHERGTNAAFGPALKALCSGEPELALRFAHYVVSDVLATFDETLKHMEDVQKHEAERATPEWAALPPSQRMPREDSHSLTDGNARAFVQLLTEFIALLEAVAETVPSILLLKQQALNVAELTAQLVNYLLDNLTRPHLLPAKTEKYKLDSLTLIGIVINIALQMSESEVFVAAMAADERSFKADKLARIIRFAGNLLPTQSEVRKFEKLVQRATAIRASVAAADKVEEEAPEEFLDPISCALMDDPVQLPTSGKVVDRATISRILLSRAEDPFNRKPLTVEELRDMPELRAAIRAWREAHPPRLPA